MENPPSDHIATGDEPINGGAPTPPPPATTNNPPNTTITTTNPDANLDHSLISSTAPPPPTTLDGGATTTPTTTEDGNTDPSIGTTTTPPPPTTVEEKPEPVTAPPPPTTIAAVKEEPVETLAGTASEEIFSSDETSNYGTPSIPTDPTDKPEETEEDENGSPHKKQKKLTDLPKPEPEPDSTPTPRLTNGTKTSTAKSSKNSKKKTRKDIWTTTTRKAKKKTKNNLNSNTQNTKNAPNNSASTEDKVLITPIPRFPDKNDDSPDAKICLSKAYKAEKVELSDDRLTASSIKGYRMVRATRGVCEGAWYFEIKVVHLGETGHTRLGWSTEKGDLQAPVGYDGNSFGYRDVDGSKVHKALREKYGEEGYKEGDVIGFYISLPNGGEYAPDPPRLVWYKGQRYAAKADGKDDSPKVVPGSELSFFKNGICQGVAYQDLIGGRYYPAASMYTLPNQPNCVVKFNFGPDFEHFPADFGERPFPRPMIEVPYHGYDGRVIENGIPWNITRMCPMYKAEKGQDAIVVKAAETVG